MVTNRKPLSPTSAAPLNAVLTRIAEREERVPVWELSSSSDRRALDIVDGTGPFEGSMPHYSRRTPGSKTFTGVGQEIVLVTDCGRAVFACVRQKTPSAKGSGSRRARDSITDEAPRFVFRNMVFRNLGAGISSVLIRAAVETTLRLWAERYGDVPAERLRTEIDIDAIRSPNPGYCYQRAGWEKGAIKRGKMIMWAPTERYASQVLAVAIEMAVER